MLASGGYLHKQSIHNSLLRCIQGVIYNTNKNAESYIASYIKGYRQQGLLIIVINTGIWCVLKAVPARQSLYGSLLIGCTCNSCSLSTIEIKALLCFSFFTPGNKKTRGQKQSLKSDKQINGVVTCPGHQRQPKSSCQKERH